MAVTLKYQSRQIEKNDGGQSTVQAWTGTKEEIEALAEEIQPGSPAEYGTLESVRIYQDGGNIWAVERRYAKDQDGDFVARPHQVYGRKSAQLRGSMLSLPLENHPNYKTNWNYFLAAAPDVTMSPAWWLTATDPILSNEDAQKYKWIMSTSETPVDGNGKQWNIMCKPTFPGVNSYDVAVYTVTETAKFKSAKAAGKMVAMCLNKIGFPNETFGITGGDWKCDDATVSYNGSRWYATLTWTRSGDDKGWYKEIYGGLNK
ncbi:MAG: hypothetical protein J5858_07505 [Lentisphaeria bacterium]|nr:hypothetical protein [Lentisphaeria bacterium]